MYLPVFFEAINVSFIVEVKCQLFKVLVQILFEYLLQTITKKRKQAIKQFKTKRHLSEKSS